MLKSVNTSLDYKCLIKICANTLCFSVLEAYACMLLRILKLRINCLPKWFYQLTFALVG